MMLPAQNKSYGGAMKVIALLPFLVVVTLLIAGSAYGWAYLHTSSSSMPPDAVLGTVQETSDQVASRFEGSLVYPGTGDTKRASGSLASLAGQNPITASMVPPLIDSAPDMAGLPLVYTTFVSSDDANKVEQWYDGQLRDRGWCKPSSLNTSPSILLYVRQQREAFVIVSIPMPDGAGAGSSSMLTWYTVFPNTDRVPAC